MKSRSAAASEKKLPASRLAGGKHGELAGLPWRLTRPSGALARLKASSRRARRPRRDAVRVLTAPIGVIAAAALVVALCLFSVDERISRAMADEPVGVRTFLAYATDAGLVAWYLYPAAALVLVLLLIDWQSPSRQSRLRVHALATHGCYLAISVSLAGITTAILKVVFGRARPDLLADGYGSLAFEMLRFGYNYASFPSGHSTTMGAVTAASMIWFPAIRWPLLAAGACLALSRIVVQAHFPSDVVAGFSIGFLTALILARWLAVRRIAYRLPRRGNGWPDLLPQRPAHR